MYTLQGQIGMAFHRCISLVCALFTPLLTFASIVLILIPDFCGNSGDSTQPWPALGQTKEEEGEEEKRRRGEVWEVQFLNSGIPDSSPGNSLPFFPLSLFSTFFLLPSSLNFFHIDSSSLTWLIIRYFPLSFFLFSLF